MINVSKRVYKANVQTIKLLFFIKWLVNVTILIKIVFSMTFWIKYKKNKKFKTSTNVNSKKNRLLLKKKKNFDPKLWETKSKLSWMNI